MYHITRSDRFPRDVIDKRHEALRPSPRPLAVIRTKNDAAPNVTSYGEQA
jgi:hypothetical protein